MSQRQPTKHYKVLLDGNIKEFTFVDSKTVNPACGQISWETPIAQAIQMLDIGSATTVELPSGSSVRIALIDTW